MISIMCTRVIHIQKHANVHIIHHSDMTPDPAAVSSPWHSTFRAPRSVLHLHVYIYIYMYSYIYLSIYLSLSLYI